METPAGLAVWREQLTPVFQLIDLMELECLEAVASGDSYGECCETLVRALGEAAAIPYAGAMLGRWLGNGWITKLIT